LSPDTVEPSAELASSLAATNLPGAVVEVQLLPMAPAALDAWVDAAVRGGKADIVLNLATSEDRAQRGVRNQVLNRDMHHTSIDPFTDEPKLVVIDPGGPIRRPSTLPIDRIVADQQRRFGKDGLRAQRNIGSGDVGPSNHLAFKELEATTGSGAMVGVVNVVDAVEDRPFVLALLGSAIEEMRTHRKTSRSRSSAV
jgi:hypothetical protein